MEKVRLDKQIKAYLDARGMTPAELARKTSVPKSTLADYISGAPPKRIEHIKAIAMEFNTTIDHLLYGIGVHSTTPPDIALDELLEDKWLSGVFEVRIRRVKNSQTKKLGN